MLIKQTNKITFKGKTPFNLGHCSVPLDEATSPTLRNIYLKLSLKENFWERKLSYKNNSEIYIPRKSCWTPPILWAVVKINSLFFHILHLFQLSVGWARRERGSATILCLSRCYGGFVSKWAVEGLSLSSHNLLANTRSKTIHMKLSWEDLKEKWEGKMQHL